MSTCFIPPNWEDHTRLQDHPRRIINICPTIKAEIGSFVERYDYQRYCEAR
jgi:hypothetical protein